MAWAFILNQAGDDATFLRAAFQRLQGGLRTWTFPVSPARISPSRHLSPTFSPQRAGIFFISLCRSKHGTHTIAFDILKQPQNQAVLSHELWVNVGEEVRIFFLALLLTENTCHQMPPVTRNGHQRTLSFVACPSHSLEDFRHFYPVLSLSGLAFSYSSCNLSQDFCYPQIILGPPLVFTLQFFLGNLENNFLSLSPAMTGQVQWLHLSNSW